jgi:hypothetical protein
MAGAAAALLSGCATGYLLDNQVQSFSGLQGLPATPTYRFERLPSQALQPAQNQIEALADPVLFKYGLRRDDAAPRYSVQVSARMQRAISPFADPWDTGWGWGHPLAYGPRAGLGFGYGYGFGGPFPRMEQPWFQREVAVLVREVATNRVVYESHATNDGPWIDNAVVIPAMFEAALQGFPNPPQGPRRVDIQLAQRTPAAQAAAQPAPASRAVPSAPAAAPAPAAPAR